MLTAVQWNSVAPPVRTAMRYGYDVLDFQLVLCFSTKVGQLRKDIWIASQIFMPSALRWACQAPIRICFTRHGFLQTRKDLRSSRFSLTLLWVCAFSNFWLMERNAYCAGPAEILLANKKIHAVLGALSRALIGGRPQPWRPLTNRSESGFKSCNILKKQPLCQEMQKELEKFKAAKEHF